MHRKVQGVLAEGPFAPDHLLVALAHGAGTLLPARRLSRRFLGLRLPLQHQEFVPGADEPDAHADPQ
eukprot:4146836-Lingulodinium_polyedra.AAC.1